MVSDEPESNFRITFVVVVNAVQVFLDFVFAFVAFVQIVFGWVDQEDNTHTCWLSIKWFVCEQKKMKKKMQNITDF